MDNLQLSKPDTFGVELLLWLVFWTWLLGLFVGVVIGPIILAVLYFFLIMGAWIMSWFSCCIFSCTDEGPSLDEVAEGTSSAHAHMWDNVLAGETMVLVVTLCIAGMFALLAVLWALSNDKDKLPGAGTVLFVHLFIGVILYLNDGFSYAAKGWEVWIN